MQREPLSSEARDRAFKRWRELGFSGRHARVLIDLGYVSVGDLKNATDLDLRVLPGIAREGLVLIYRLIGRDAPIKLKSKAEVRAEHERAFRSSMSEDHLNRLLDEIAAMAGDALDKRINRPPKRYGGWPGDGGPAGKESATPATTPIPRRVLAFADRW